MLKKKTEGKSDTGIKETIKPDESISTNHVRLAGHEGVK